MTFSTEEQTELQSMIDKALAENDANWQAQISYEHAYALVARAVISVFHNREIEIPSIANDADNPDHEAVLEVSNMAINYVTMGLDFEMITDAVKTNDVLRSEWDRFTMMLKMAEE